MKLGTMRFRYCMVRIGFRCSSFPVLKYKMLWCYTKIYEYITNKLSCKYVEENLKHPIFREKRIWKKLKTFPQFNDQFILINIWFTLSEIVLSNNGKRANTKMLPSIRFMPFNTTDIIFQMHRDIGHIIKYLASHRLHIATV